MIGIINAFAQIGMPGSASLEMVGPGIAEALIATAIGLFAAIPATIFYNIFVARLRDLQAAIRPLRDASCKTTSRTSARSVPAPARAVER